MISIGAIRSCSRHAIMINCEKPLQINILRLLSGAEAAENTVKIGERRQKVAAETPQGG